MHHFAKVAFADPLKEGAAAMFRLDDDQLYGRAKDKPLDWLPMAPREILQKLGTEFARNMIHKDIWVKVMQQKVIEWHTRFGIDSFVISDCRFDNEAQWVRANGGRIVHICGRRLDLGSNAGHSSERGVLASDSDLYIRNDGTYEDLWKQVEKKLI